MFQDLFEYFKVYNCFFWWFGAIPKCSWCSWGCSHLAAWLSPQTSMGWAFFQGELIGRCAGRSGLPGKCEGDHSTGAGLHLHPAHPSQGPFGGSKMADIYCGPRPEIIRGLVRKSANWQIPLLISLSNSFFPWPQLGEVQEVHHGSRRTETPTLRGTLSGDLLGFRSLKMRKVHTSSVRTRIEQCCWKLRSVGIWFDM